MKAKNTFIPPDLTVEELSKALFSANRSLEEKNQELIHSQKEKLDFFSNLSHDLRSPITALHSSLDYLSVLLQNNTQESEVTNTLTIMENRLSYLENIVNDIFLLSSLDASAREFHFEEIPIGCFLEDFFFSCEADSKYQERQLILQVPEQSNSVVFVDTHMLTRVLDNLFSNALKYSHTQDTICLSLQEMPDFICISVADSGIGISSENINKVFDRTFQESSARTPDKQCGCGLGLSIVKMIVEKMGGQVSCKSVLKKGSTFSFTLPFLSPVHS